MFPHRVEIPKCMLETRNEFEAILSVLEHFSVFDPLADPNIKIQPGHSKEGSMLVKTHPGFTVKHGLLNAQKAICAL